MINSKTSSMKMMKQIMLADKNANNLVEKYSLVSVNNRLKYEIRMRKKID